MIFLLQMAAFMDDDVFDIFGWEMDKIEIQRKFLIIGARSSFGNCFSETKFGVFYFYFFAIFFDYGSGIFF